MDDTEHAKSVLTKHGYEYIDLIGHGSFSSVFLCRSTKYNEEFAVKRVVNNKVTSSEFDALTCLNHPYIIKLYEFFDEEDSQYLVMEYCPNGSFLKKGQLDFNSFKYYAQQILEAMAFCHSNKIAHRDIKPDNIFIDKYGHAKIADFGFAKEFSSSLKSSERCGSLMYFAPEVLNDSTFNPFQADIWALGVTFYYMATGKFPYSYHSIDILEQSVMLGLIDFSKVDLNPKIKSLIGKMTAKIPRLRPSCEELLKNSLFGGLKSASLTNPILIHHSSSRNFNKVMPHRLSFVHSFSTEAGPSNETKQSIKIRNCKSVDIFSGSPENIANFRSNCFNKL